MIVKLKLCESSFQALVDLKLEEVMQTMKLWTHFLSVSELDAVQSLVEKGAETAAAAILILICVSETTDIIDAFFTHSIIFIPLSEVIRIDTLCTSVPINNSDLILSQH